MVTRMAVDDRLDFVRQLKLAEPPRLPLRVAAALAAPVTPPPVPGQPAANVDAGSLVSFVGSVSPQSQADALNSTLLAYLGATAQFDKENDTQDWYNSYTQTLAAVGWDPQAFQFTEYTASGSTFSIDQVVLQVLGALATSDEIAVVTAMLTALKSLPSASGIMQIWNSQSHTDRNGNFQLSAANETAGALALTVGAFYFSTTQTIDTLFWTTYSSSTINLYKAAQTITLDNDVYSTVRAQIVQRLGAYATSYVANIPLPPLPPKH